MNVYKATTLIWLHIVPLVCLSARAEPAFPGKETQWKGFARYDYLFDHEHVCTVVVPKTPTAEKRWVMRGCYFGPGRHFDIEMLRRGFYIVYVKTKLFGGSPEEVELKNKVYEHVVEKYAFHRKVVLEGMSRGGLSVYNWAAANPKKVACIYADAPVCDFKSWPAGLGKSKIKEKKPNGLAGIMKAWGFASKEEALAYKGNPVDNLEPLAKKDVPLIHVVGDKDTMVPVEENTAILERNYKALGGTIIVIHKPECEHHPHGLDDITPVVEFVLKHATKP